MATNCVLANIKEIGKKSEKYFLKRIKEENLPIVPRHMALFFTLPNNKKKILFNELVSLLKISKSTLSDMITKYKNLDLLDVSICDEDKRMIYIGLNDNSLKLIKLLKGFEQEFLNQMMKGFSDEKKEVFLKQIIQVNNNLNK